MVKTTFQSFTESLKRAKHRASEGLSFTMSCITSPSQLLSLASDVAKVQGQLDAIKLVETSIVTEQITTKDKLILCISEHLNFTNSTQHPDLVYQMCQQAMIQNLAMLLSAASQIEEA